MLEVDSALVVDPYREREGIRVPPTPVTHREDEYDSRGFAILAAMQSNHFWYRGRHRFLLHAVDRHLDPARSRRVIDLGGGCGGWIAYLAKRAHFPASELALADSSQDALRFASRILPASTSFYQIDLLNLGWKNRWDVAFLLDVLEHIPDHELALRQILDALVPGGLLFITVPALQFFWSWNDEIAHHQRRYCRADFHELADRCGFRLADARYFMFFLSPLLLVSRAAAGSKVKDMTEEQRQSLMSRMHRVPPAPINSLFAGIFGCETPIGHLARFPWGTSLLAVLEKPAAGVSAASAPEATGHSRTPLPGTEKRYSSGLGNRVERLIGQL
jgi:SAM-dependent methyltransferase